MNNTNPFVPQGSLLEQSKRRSRMKLAVFCVLAISVASLTAMLIQGCKRETEANPPDTTVATADTNVPTMDTNPPPVEASNPPVTVPPVAMPVPAPEAASSEYAVVKGDTLATIAKKNGISLKALEAANPNVQPTKLQIGQKLVIPAATTSMAAPTAASTDMADAGGEQVYTIKSGDTLDRIAKHFSVSVKAIETENNLTTTKIIVGKKLKIPAKVEAAAPVPVAPAPPAPVTPPVPAPAPATTPSGQ
jgi:LysM repeat protein